MERGEREEKIKKMAREGGKEMEGRGVGGREGVGSMQRGWERGWKVRGDETNSAL